MRLQVKNFSCLADIDIEIDDFTVIIGEQASGKSLICRLCFFFQQVVLEQIINSIIDNSGTEGLSKKLNFEFTKFFPEYTWYAQEFLIQLTRGNTNISFSHEHNKPLLTIYLSENVQKEINILLKEFNNSYRQSKRLPRPFIDEIISKHKLSRLLKLFDETIYIPSGRSFFSTIKNNIFLLAASNISIDPILQHFGQIYELLKKSHDYEDWIENSPLLKAFNTTCEAILKGKYVFDNQDEWITSNKSKISISNASSGQQEVLPLLIALKYFICDKLKSHQSLIIEEPEAHLFPSSQKAVIDLLFLTQNESSPPDNFLITTHSPYILSCCNNNILKYYNKINVRAYYIANGTAKDIIDPETQLIDGEKLDKISEEIANEFYAALERTPQ